MKGAPPFSTVSDAAGKIGSVYGVYDETAGVKMAELLNIFLIVLMALFLNAQGRAEFPVQILCLLMNRRAFQTFDVGCAGEK